MPQVLTKEQLKVMKKKAILQELGYRNIGHYYKETGHVGKFSHKDAMELYILNKH